MLLSFHRQPPARYFIYDIFRAARAKRERDWQMACRIGHWSIWAGHFMPRGRCGENLARRRASGAAGIFRKEGRECLLAIALLFAPAIGNKLI